MAKQQRRTSAKQCFATAANRGRVSLESSDAEILEIIDSEVENAIERSFNILRTRIDRFGTSQPNIQRIQGTGRIQVELPGVDNQERVRNLLQGVAKLQFWEVAEVNELGGSLDEINAAWVADNQNADTSAEDTVSTENMTEEDSLRNALEKQLEEIDPINQSNDVSPIYRLLQQNYGLAYQVRDTIVINRILNNPDYKSLIPRDIKLLWGVKPFVPEGTDLEILELYAIRTTRGADQAPWKETWLPMPVRY